MTNLSSQALTAAAKALAAEHHEAHGNDTHEAEYVDRRHALFIDRAEIAITAYLNALPPISEGIVERLRAMVGTGGTLWFTGRSTRAMGEDILNAADTIQHLSAKLANHAAGQRSRAETGNT